MLVALRALTVNDFARALAAASRRPCPWALPRVILQEDPRTKDMDSGVPSRTGRSGFTSLSFCLALWPGAMMSSLWSSVFSSLKWG